MTAPDRLVAAQWCSTVDLAFGTENLRWLKPCCASHLLLEIHWQKNDPLAGPQFSKALHSPLQLDERSKRGKSTYNYKKTCCIHVVHQLGNFIRLILLVAIISHTQKRFTADVRDQRRIIERMSIAQRQLRQSINRSNLLSRAYFDTHFSKLTKFSNLKFLEIAVIEQNYQIIYNSFRFGLENQLNTKNRSNN